MTVFQRMLRTLMLRFALSPREALAEIGRRLLPEKPSSCIDEIKAMASAAPLILQIETTNVCNARCVFCAYPRMQRPKGVMDLALFEKIIRDYADMGGGAVSLTPIMGEPLLDPHLLRRFEILADHPAINRISMTTNAIALDRYSDSDLLTLLERLGCLQVSVGGLDAETYRKMYGVDRYERVKRAMDRLVALNETVSRPATLIFAFRTTDWTFEWRFRKQLDSYRKKGVLISHMWTFFNYGGLVESDEQKGLTVNRDTTEKNRPCASATIHLAVCWDGSITACGCADAEGRGLRIGQAGRDPLAEVWAGEKRSGILESFEKGTLPDICRQCSAYHPDRVFAQAIFKEIKPGCPLPAEFYHQFWGA